MNKKALLTAAVAGLFVANLAVGTFAEEVKADAPATTTTTKKAVKKHAKKAKKAAAVSTANAAAKEASCKGKSGCKSKATCKSSEKKAH